MTPVSSLQAKEIEQKKGGWKDPSILSFIDGKYTDIKVFA